MTRRMMGAESGSVKRRSCEVLTYASSRRLARAMTAASLSSGSEVSAAAPSGAVLTASASMEAPVSWAATASAGAVSSAAGAAGSAAGVSPVTAAEPFGMSANGSWGCTRPPIRREPPMPRPRFLFAVAPAAAAAAAARAFSATNAAAEVSSCTALWARAGSVTSPACAMTTPHLVLFTNSIILGSVKPVTSFTMEAPTRTAALATSTWRVSMDTMAPRWASARMTGSTRLASSSADTGVKPGRVDSPPTSMMSAPASSMATPRATAESTSRLLSSPSLNESGVTFSTPMMRGRSNLISYFPQRQVLVS